MSARIYIAKLLSLRGKMLRDGKSMKDGARMAVVYAEVKRWYDFWKPTDEQAKKYMVKHRELIEFLLPGKGSKCEETWRRNLETILE